MSQFAYAFDPHDTNADNLILGEVHNLPKEMSPYRVIIPNFAPFFYNEEMKLIHDGVELTEGVDYYMCLMYLTGTEMTARPMYAGFWVINPSLTGNFEVDYHTLGDKFPVERSLLDDYLNNRQEDPQTTPWETVIGKDPYFPPVDIQFDRDAFNDEIETQKYIQFITDVVAAKDPARNEVHLFMEVWYDKLKAIIDQSPILTHQDDRDNIHRLRWFMASALHKDGISQDALKAYGKSLEELTNYIHDNSLTQDDLDQYVLLEGDRVIEGDIQIEDGLLHLYFSRGNGQDDEWAILNLTNGQVSFGVVETLNYESAGNARIRSGTNELTVVSSDPADKEALKLNGKPLLHDGNIADHIPSQGTHIIDIHTLDHSSITFTGKGVGGNPLKATITLNDATETVAGVAIVEDDPTVKSTTKVGSSFALNLIQSEVDNKVDATITINGMTLDKDVVLTTTHLNLDNVQNLSDVKLPDNQNHRDLLTGKALATHTHPFEEINIPYATTAINGVVVLAEEPSDSSTDKGFSADALKGLYNAVDVLESRANDCLPDDAIDVKQWGMVEYVEPTADVANFVINTNGVSSYFTARSYHTIEASAIDLKVLFPTNYQNSTFYIYAAIDGQATFKVLEKLESNSPALLKIGYCKTDANGIIDWKIEPTLSLGTFREFQEHLTNPTPHEIDYSGVTKESIGLGLIEDYPPSTDFNDSIFRDEMANSPNAVIYTGSKGTNLQAIAPTSSWTSVGTFFVRKRIYFDGTPHNFHVFVDDHGRLFIDDEMSNQLSIGDNHLTLTPEKGWRTVTISLYNIGGPGYTALEVHRQDDNSLAFKTDATWKCMQKSGDVTRYWPYVDTNPSAEQPNGTTLYATQELLRSACSWSSRLIKASGKVVLDSIEGDYVVGRVPVPDGAQGLEMNCGVSPAQMSNPTGIWKITPSVTIEGNEIVFKCHKTSIGGTNQHSTILYNAVFIKDKKIII